MTDLLDLHFPPQRRDMDFDNVLRSVNGEPLESNSKPDMEVIASSLKSARHTYPKQDALEERRLIDLVKKGNAAEDKLVRHNAQLIFSVAKSRYMHGISDSIGVLFSHGALGFIRSLLLFDTSRGLSPSTYIAQWIRSEISNNATVPSKTIRISTSARVLLRKMRRCEDAHLAQFNRLPTIEEYAEATGASVKTITEAQGFAIGEARSLHVPARRDSMNEAAGSDIALDLLVDANASSSLDIASHNEVMRNAYEIMNDGTLSDVEIHVLKSRFLHHDEVTHRTLADYYELSRSRIQQIEKKAKRKLRQRLDLRGFAPA